MDEYDDYETNQSLVVQLQNKLNVLSNCVELKGHVSKKIGKDNTAMIWSNTKKKIDEAIYELDFLII